MSYEPVTVREAAQTEILLFVGLAFVGALAVVYWGFQTYQFGRLIRDTPPEPVRGVAMGRTEIAGEIIPASEVYDRPFTEGRCVYAEYKVREYREYPHDDDRDDQWETVQSGSVSVPFYIDDGTGQMLVEPTEEAIYEISDEYSTEIQVDGGEQPPDQVQEFLAPGATGGAIGGGDGGGGVTARVSATLHSVTGGLLGSSDEQSESGDATAENAEPPAPDEQPDADGDAAHVSRSQIGSVGSTNRDRKYIQRVLPMAGETNVFGGATRRDPAAVGPVGDDVAVRADPSTGEFIISDKGEFELARTYRNRSLLYITAGILASAMVLALLVQILLTGPVYGPELALP